MVRHFILPLFVLCMYPGDFIYLQVSVSVDACVTEMNILILTLNMKSLVSLRMSDTSIGLSDRCVRRDLGRGHTKETGNRNATAISENCYQPELNTYY
jgi:hypothetical protein